MNTAQKISLITPSYNQGHFIEETIKSVLNQQYNELEYIVIDGGSNDNTIELIKKYEQQIAYWVCEKDKGQSDAINKGFAKATGDIINWLNSDDYYEPGSLQHIAEQFADSSISCYCGISRIFGEGKDYLSAGTDIYPGNLHKTIGWARIDQPETFFRRSTIKAVGPINECLHYVMDKDLWIRYLCRFGLEGIKRDDKLVVHFRLHDKSKTVSLQNNFLKEHHSLYYTYALLYELSDYVQILENLFDVEVLSLQNVSKALSKEDWERILNYFLLQQGLQAYAVNNYMQANKILKKVNKKGLAKEDEKELFKVQQRIKLIPPGIKKIWNKINSSL